MSIVTLNMMYFGIFVIMLGFVFCLGMVLRKWKCLRDLRKKELLEIELLERSNKKSHRRVDRFYK